MNSALGKTVSELDIKDARVVAAKTKFSMYVPEVQKYMQENLGDSPAAVLFGIEVCAMESLLCEICKNLLRILMSMLCIR